MGRYIADQNQVGFYYESGTYANVSGALQWPGMVISHDIGDDYEVEQVRFLGDATQDVSFQQTVTNDVEGTLTQHPQDWKFLGLAMGSVVDTSGTTSVHEIKGRNNDTQWPYTSGTHCPPPSFSTEDTKVAPGTGRNFIRTVNGATINTYSLSAEQGGIVTEEINYLAKEAKFSSGAKTAITANTLRPFLWRDVTWQVEGTTFPQMQNFTFEINRNTERNRYPNGSDQIEALAWTQREYTFDVTMDANSTNTKTLYETYYKGGSSFNQTLQVQATPTRTMLITMSGCRVTSMDVPSPNEGVNETSATITPTTVTAIGSDAVPLYNPW